VKVAGLLKYRVWAYAIGNRRIYSVASIKIEKSGDSASGGFAMKASRSWGTLADRRVLSAPTHSACKALLAYWQSKRSGGSLPRRKDIVPAEIPQLLPHLMIIEPVNGGGDWKYRLVGTAVAQRYGFDWTGKKMTELLDAATAPAIIRFYSDVAAMRAPNFVMGRAMIEGRDHVVYECGSFPILGSDGVTVWILMGVFFHN
jgi:hypothetical protein